jgi:hypothetical protein
MLFSTASSPIELEQLKEKIQLKGDEIRQLKADGLDKAALTPYVEELLALKAQLPAQDKPPPAPKAQKEKPKKQQQKKKPATQKPTEETLSESELRANRLAKVELMRQAGVEPFAYTFAATHSAVELAAMYEGKLQGGQEDETVDVAVAGRIMTRRVFGKLAFFTLQDASGTIQLQFDQSRLGDTFEVRYKDTRLAKRLVFAGTTRSPLQLFFLDDYYSISRTGLMVVILLASRVPFGEPTRES